MERSSNTFPQTHAKYEGLAQTVLTWEGKVFAAADADAAKTNWKHKVTPERGDLIIAHRGTGDKPLFQPMVTELAIHTRHQAAT